MTWLFSAAMMKVCENSRSLPGLVAEYLGESSSDGEPYAPLNVMPTQRQFWRNDKMMDVLSRSPFGLTWKPLTESRGEELLTLFRAVFPARTLAVPEEAKESQGSGQDYGKKWRASFAKYDHDSSSWKTHQCSLFGGSELFSETWPRWGLMLNGECWERTMPAHLISGIEYGLKLPTPTANEGGRNKSASSGAAIRPSLGMMAKHDLWPTPRSCSAMAATITPESSGNTARFPNLETVVGRRTWPTPIARDSRTVGGGERMASSLGTEPLITQVAEHEKKTSGRLNPEWIEWLMNWPTGWTDLKPLEMARFQSWQQWHGKFLVPEQRKEVES